jgi:hypothetical protein
MTEGSTGSMLNDLETLFRHGTTTGLSDGQLLLRFVEGRAPAHAAFEAIVRRHGPMVLGVAQARHRRATEQGADGAQNTAIRSHGLHVPGPLGSGCHHRNVMGRRGRAV